MKPELTGKTALVTGAAGAIGKQFCLLFANAGANIVASDYAAGDTAAEFVQSIKSAGAPECYYVGTDIGDGSATREMIANAEQRMGSVDILINSAGMQHTVPTEDFPADMWDKLIAVNLSGTFHTIAAALPGMRKRDYGRIINMSSVHGLVASIEKSAYCASKFGVVGLTKVVALETAKQNITCNALCPCFVHTPLIEAQIKAVAEKRGIDMQQAGYELIAAKTPSERFTSPEQVAQFALFLCSDAASNITGSSMSIDGGWTAQ